MQLDSTTTAMRKCCKIPKYKGSRLDQVATGFKESLHYCSEVILVCIIVSLRSCVSLPPKAEGLTSSHLVLSARDSR